MENKEEKEIKEETTNDEFGGTFHERDSHAENDIVKEISDSFLDYSMSVITSRAIPDLRDGLKPVHRRILWSMFEEGNTPDKPHKKSATTVGYVMGHYHPHGDSSIYEAMVRLAQDFNQRYMLVDGHGNFGNIEGDGAAAYRYTEARLSKISLEMLRDIRKNTVDMDDNFDETCKEPKVLPSRFPNVLVNGSMGIAVGMATNIPPHNLGEVIDGCVAYIDNPDIDVNGLMNYIKGPDFPTGGIILGNSGIKKAYETGRGSITIRSRTSIEEVGNHSQIVITEVPYGTNTLDLKNKVAELVHNKTIEGISDYHTDLKNGVKIDNEYITGKAKVRILKIDKEKNISRLEIIIHEGKNREVRKMCETVGKKVIALHRAKIANIDVKNLKIGQWRFLTKEEVKTIVNQ